MFIFTPFIPVGRNTSSVFDMKELRDISTSNGLSAAAYQCGNCEFYLAWFQAAVLFQAAFPSVPTTVSNVAA